jgi:outer membrane murein-binding lipoprotein Lpp
MRTGTLIAGLIFSGLFLTGCDGGEPGYLFHLIFIVGPIITIGILLLKRSDATNDSLYILEGQVKRLSAKLDALEEKITDLLEKENKGKTKK